MDLRKLKTLIDLVSESGVAELEITEGDDRVKIVNRVGAAPVAAAAPAVIATPVVASAAPAAAPEPGGPEPHVYWPMPRAAGRQSPAAPRGASAFRLRCIPCDIQPPSTIVYDSGKARRLFPERSVCHANLYHTISKKEEKHKIFVAFWKIRKILKRVLHFWNSSHIILNVPYI